MRDEYTLFSKNLHSLNFNDSLIRDFEIHAVTVRCPHIREIHLLGCALLTNSTMKYLSHLDLSRVSLSCSQIDDVGIEILLHGCQHLEYIELNQCFAMSSRILSIFTSCKYLRSLMIEDSFTITDSQLMSFLLHSQSNYLMHVSIAHCVIENKEHMVNGQISPVIYIRLPSSPNQDCSLVNRVFSYMAENLDLKSINLNALIIVQEGTSQWQMIRGSEITDLGVEYLVKKSPELVSIDLSECHNISDRGILCLAKNCRDLKMINLGVSSKVSPLSMMVLLESCPALETLRLPNSKNKLTLYFALYHLLFNKRESSFRRRLLAITSTMRHLCPLTSWMCETYLSISGITWFTVIFLIYGLMFSYALWTMILPSVLRIRHNELL